MPVQLVAQPQALTQMQAEARNVSLAKRMHQMQIRRARARTSSDAESSRLAQTVAATTDINMKPSSDSRLAAVVIRTSSKHSSTCSVSRFQHNTANQQHRLQRIIAAECEPTARPTVYPSAINTTCTTNHLFLLLLLSSSLLFLLLSLLSTLPIPASSMTLNSNNNNNNNQAGEHQLAGQMFTCGKLYYRTFHMDQQRNVLYLGAMDNLFKLNLANINKTSCLDDAIRLEPAEPQKCILKGKSESFDCRNHIKVIQPMSKLGDRLYVCGTNAYSPRDYLLHANNMSVSTDPSLGIGGHAQAECSFDPDDNMTALWVAHGNPSDAPALYTATATDFNKADPLIFRTELFNQTSGQKIHEAKRTTKYDSKWLDKPNFVGSFEIGDYVYFFFRESAVEYINCGKSIYSRVARVCKRDNGFKPAMYEKVWTTFLKARLNCSIPGEFPFYFDEIQSIYRNPYDERKFHAVFTTSNNGLTGSAICTFSLDAIQEAFNGKFKEQQSSTAAWLPVPSYKLNPNEPRPGACVDDTQALSDSLVTFTRGHPLMDSAVANDNNRPVFYRRDVMFTKIVVDIVEIDGLRYTVYFVATNTGHIYKIVEWSNGGAGMPGTGTGTGGGGFLSALSDAISSAASGAGSSGGPASSGLNSQSALVEVIEATVPEPVRAMELSSRHKSLYVASDSQVRQINLLNCKQRHDNCMQCVRDPYCGWDRKHLECRHFSSIDPINLVQDVTSDTPEVCSHSAIKHKDVNVMWGQSVHLPCKFNGFIQETQDLQQLLAAQQRQSAALQQQQQQRNAAGLPAGNSYYSGAGQQQQGLAANGASLPPVGLATDAYIQQTTQAFQGQPHGLLQPANYIQWYYHRRDNVLAPGYPVLQRRDKFILAADQGLVIMNANEPGWYQCRLGSQIIQSYNLIIDTKTCAAPNELEFRRIYADWCKEIERYKSAYRNWHAKQNRCQAFGVNQQQQQQHGQVLMMNGGASAIQQPIAATATGTDDGSMWTTHG